MTTLLSRLPMGPPTARIMEAAVKIASSMRTPPNGFMPWMSQHSAGNRSEASTATTLVVSYSNAAA